MMTSAARRNLREAMRLFNVAGFEVRDFALLDPETGEPMRVEFLVSNPGLERVILFYRPALERLGMKVDVRLVDDAQYINRLRSWDFDIVVRIWKNHSLPAMSSGIIGAHAPRMCRAHAISSALRTLQWTL